MNNNKKNNCMKCFLFLVSLFAISIQSSAQEWELVWADEFDYAGKPNEVYWSFENGFARNKELQWYQEANAFCENGRIII